MTWGPSGGSMDSPWLCLSSAGFVLCFYPLSPPQLLAVPLRDRWLSQLAGGSAGGSWHLSSKTWKIFQNKQVCKGFFSQIMLFFMNEKSWSSVLLNWAGVPERRLLYSVPWEGTTWLPSFPSHCALCCGECKVARQDKAYFWHASMEAGSTAVILLAVSVECALPCSLHLQQVCRWHWAVWCSW